MASWHLAASVVILSSLNSFLSHSFGCSISCHIGLPSSSAWPSRWDSSICPIRCFKDHYSQTVSNGFSNHQNTHYYFVHRPGRYFSHCPYRRAKSLYLQIYHRLHHLHTRLRLVPVNGRNSGHRKTTKKDRRRRYILFIKLFIFLLLASFVLDPIFNRTTSLASQILSALGFAAASIIIEDVFFKGAEE